MLPPEPIRLGHGKKIEDSRTFWFWNSRAWAILGCAGVDGRPSGVLPMTNRFTVSRTGETGVLWLRFKSQKRNSYLIVKALRRLLYPCIDSYSYLPLVVGPTVGFPLWRQRALRTPQDS
jgi:hypothetical protein